MDIQQWRVTNWCKFMVSKQDWSDNPSCTLSTPHSKHNTT